MHRRWIRVLATIFALSLLAAACGGEEDGGTQGEDPTETETESPSEDGGGGADLTIVDFGFSPADLTVADGDTITVANIGDTSHTFTTDDEAIDETIGPGEEIEIEIAGVSSQDFRCDFHSQMQGTLTVE
ncbi:MAG TPA: cupredoxin domain-containing protein [Actinomycetota bacterium]